MRRQSMNFFYYLCWNFISTKADVIWNEKPLSEGLNGIAINPFPKLEKSMDFFIGL